MSLFCDDNCFIVFIRTISPPYHCHKKFHLKPNFFLTPHFDDSPAGWGMTLINQVIIFFSSDCTLPCESGLSSYK